MAGKIIETLAQIDAENHPTKFCCGIVLWDNVVVEAAPIVGFMARGKWTRDQVRAYAIKKGWKISVVHEFERTR